MHINPFSKFKKLSELVSLDSLRRPKVVLDPKGDYVFNSRNGIDELNNMSVVLDKADWEISEELQEFVSALTSNKRLNNEEKILELFEKLSKSYTYDDNLLSYIQKDEDDKYTLPDWYGRDVDSKWVKNRAHHNKRVCYEMSRYFAKSLAEIFKNQPDYGICILWDEDLTHYFVGLTCDEYNLTLDLDNFDNIKDLTRVKTGLTINGIKILEDPSKKFSSALDSYNNDRNKYAIKAISSELKNEGKSTRTGDILDSLDDDITFFANAVQILDEKYHLDSQGMFEYMKEIADVRLGSKAREKVWKKIKNGVSDSDSKYIRCLLLDFSESQDTTKESLYLIDVDKKQFRQFNRKEFEEGHEFIPYKKLTRNWDEPYNGK